MGIGEVGVWVVFVEVRRRFVVLNGFSIKIKFLLENGFVVWFSDVRKVVEEYFEVGMGVEEFFD